MLRLNLELGKRLLRIFQYNHILVTYEYDPRTHLLNKKMFII